MIHDKETGWTEASIDINHVRLSFAEAMSLRVAVTSMRLSMNENATRTMLGEELAEGYDRHLAKIEQLIIKGKA